MTDISNRTTTRTVTVTRQQQASTTVTVASSTGVYGGVVTLSATLAADSRGLADKTVRFTVNGTTVNAVTNGSGVATVSSVSLEGLNAGHVLRGGGRFVHRRLGLPRKQRICNPQRAEGHASGDVDKPSRYHLRYAARRSAVEGGGHGTRDLHLCSGGSTTLNAGANQVLSVGFAPSDAANYNPAALTTVSINVLRASPKVSLGAIRQTSSTGHCLA